VHRLPDDVRKRTSNTFPAHPDALDLTARRPLCARRECPYETHAVLQRYNESACSMGVPSPPPAASPSPRPPPPPYAPPPIGAGYGTLREAGSERDSDPDCVPVSYEACRLASIDIGRAKGLSEAITISMVACEGHGNDLSGCFVGCTLGASDGAPALYTFLTPEKLALFGEYNSYRCAAADHEYCLCASPSPPPPPPPTRKDETDWIYAGTGTAFDYTGHASAFFKHVATDVAMPSDFQSHPVDYACPGAETGGLECARHCSDELGDNLAAFQVTGLLAPPPPPSPGAPPQPPSPPPAPLPPYGFQFNGASDACTNSGLYHGAECRDGGVGSVYPHYCDYGSQACFAFEPTLHDSNPDPLASRSLSCAVHQVRRAALPQQRRDHRRRPLHLRQQRPVRGRRRRLVLLHRRRRQRLRVPGGRVRLRHRPHRLRANRRTAHAAVARAALVRLPGAAAPAAAAPAAEPALVAAAAAAGVHVCVVRRHVRLHDAVLRRRRGRAPRQDGQRARVQVRLRHAGALPRTVANPRCP